MYTLKEKVAMSFLKTGAYIYFEAGDDVDIWFIKDDLTNNAAVAENNNFVLVGATSLTAVVTSLYLTALTIF